MLVFACTLGCTAERAITEDGADQAIERAAVYDGVMSGPAEDHVVSVLSKDDLNTTRRCTGTLVAENLVVTAQHCVSNFADGSFSCTSEGELTPGSTRGQMGTLLEPARVSVRIGATVDIDAPPEAVGAQVFAPLTTSICKNDIAFLVLDRPIANLPLSSIRLAGDLAPRELVRVVGYGLPDIDSRYYRDDVEITRVGPTETRPAADPIAPRSFDALGGVLCAGDSGGPAFADSGALVGVFSLVVGACNSPRTRNVFTQTAPFADFARSAFEAAGATPILEPGSGSAGAGGSGGTPEGGAGGEGGEDIGGRSGSGSAMAGNGGSGGAGRPATAGDSGSAGAPARRGLRQAGGCRCDVPGGRGTGAPWPVALGAMLVLGWARRRRGSRSGNPARVFV